MSTRNRLLIGAALVALLAVAAWAGARLLVAQLDQPLRLDAQPLVIEVAAGESLSHVVDRLEARGVIRHGWLLRYWARYHDKTLVQRGEYELRSPLTPLQLLDKLNRGDVVQYRITFPEGSTVAQMRAILAASDDLVAETHEMDPGQLAAAVGVPRAHPEGWFYPDTYFFVRGTTDLELLRRAHQRMSAVLEEVWKSAVPPAVLDDPYDLLILASVVERETAVPDERAAIAGVFVRRLERGMRLQTDPTVIYGIENFDGNLTRQHLAQETPWNTYVISGLPATPIANPGRDALEASMHPEPGDALFFVARGDGRHFFSATLAEHQQAVRQYQIEQRPEQYRSTPEPD